MLTLKWSSTRLFVTTLALFGATALPACAEAVADRFLKNPVVVVDFVLSLTDPGKDVPNCPRSSLH